MHRYTCKTYRMTKQMNEIAAEVRAAAARKRMKQGDLAEVLHLSRMAFYRRMSGQMEFQVSELYALADALEIDVHELIPSSRKEAA